MLYRGPLIAAPNQFIVKTTSQTFDFSQESPFIQAVASRNLALVKKLLQEDKSEDRVVYQRATVVGNFQFSPLMIACLLGDQELFDCLRANKAYLQGTDKQGRTLLHITARYCLQPEMIKHVYNAYPESEKIEQLDNADKDKMDFITQAIASCNVKNFKAACQLLQAIGEADRASHPSLPMIAICNGDVAMIKAALDLFPKEDHAKLLNVINNHGETNAVMLAAISGKIENFNHVCGLLSPTDLKKQLEHRDTLQSNLVMNAAFFGSTEVLLAAINLYPQNERAEQLTARNLFNYNVLEMAQSNNNPPAVAQAAAHLYSQYVLPLLARQLHPVAPPAATPAAVLAVPTMPLVGARTPAAAPQRRPGSLSEATPEPKRHRTAKK